MHITSSTDTEQDSGKGEAAAQEIRASGHPQAQEFAEENVLKVRTAVGMTEMFERIAKERWPQGR